MAVPTLSEFYRTVFIPLRIEARQLNTKTSASYEVSLNHWSRITGDPPVDTITDLTCATFLSEMRKLKGKTHVTMSPASLQKHCNQLQAVLNLTGPRTSAVRRGQRLIADVPFFELPKMEKKRVDKNWRIEDVRALFNVCDIATEPNIPDVPAPDWWRAFVTFFYFAGPRVFAGTNCCYSDFEANGEWITLRDDISKGKHGMRQFVHPEAREYLERIKRPGRDIMLEWPNWERRKRIAYDQLRELQEAAGFPEARRFGFHSFRKTHASVKAGTDAAQAKEKAIDGAQRSCGHSDRSMTLDFYLGADVVDEMEKQSILQMPLVALKEVDVEPVTLKPELPRVETDMSYLDWVA